MKEKKNPYSLVFFKVHVLYLIDQIVNKEF